MVNDVDAAKEAFLNINIINHHFNFIASDADGGEFLLEAEAGSDYLLECPSKIKKIKKYNYH